MAQYGTLFLETHLNRPNVSAALASVGKVSSYYRLNPAILKAAGIDPADVRDKLVCTVWDDTSGTPVKTGAAKSGTDIKGGQDDYEGGSLFDLTAYVTAAGTYHLRFTWSVSGKVKNDAGATVLNGEEVAVASHLLHVVAT